MEKRKFTAEELERILKGFTSKGVPKRSPNLPPKVLMLSEGCKFLLWHLDTDWLFRVIITYQQLPEIRNMNFQLWQVQHNKEDQWFMFLADEDDNLIAINELRGIEFPLSIFFIIVHDGVVMLQSEFSP